MGKLIARHLRFPSYCRNLFTCNFDEWTIFNFYMIPCNIYFKKIFLPKMRLLFARSRKQTLFPLFFYKSGNYKIIKSVYFSSLDSLIQTRAILPNVIGCQPISPFRLDWSKLLWWVLFDSFDSPRMTPLSPLSEPRPKREWGNRPDPLSSVIS